MREILRQAMDQQIPVDIYLRIAIDEQSPRCLLYYPAFLVTEINNERNTFSGYTIQMRNTPLGDRILTEDNIGLVCNVYSALL